MKKILLLSCLLFLIALPVFAQDISLKPDCNAELAPGQPGACGLGAALDFIRKLINLMLIISVPLGALFIAWGGFNMITAGGDTGKFEKGKEIIYAAVIGLVIAFGAYLIITGVTNFLKTGSPL